MYKLMFLILSIFFNMNNTSNISITNINGYNYRLNYKGNNYNIIYTTDNWKIIDSYKITNEKDMKIIVSKLINIHPIHSSDYKTYRTVDDLVYEWKQHNLAYYLLPNSKYKDMAKDVDLNPEDQNKNYIDFYMSRK